MCNCSADNPDLTLAGGAEHESAISFLTEGMGRMKISKQEKESAEEEAKIMYNCEIAMHKMATNQVDTGPASTATVAMRDCVAVADG